MLTFSTQTNMLKGDKEKSKWVRGKNNEIVFSFLNLFAKNKGENTNRQSVRPLKGRKKAR